MDTREITLTLVTALVAVTLLTTALVTTGETGQQWTLLTGLIGAPCALTAAIGVLTAVTGGGQQ